MKEKSQTHIGILLILSFLVVLISLALEVLRRQRERDIFPLVSREALRFGLDPSFVMAIISVESNFNPKARGSKGEIGLMQIMPFNAKKAARALKIPSQKPKEFFKPRINLRLGCWYLSQLKKHRKIPESQRVAYLAAEYNGGWKNVRRWIKIARFKKISFEQAITFPSTRQYIRNVLWEYQRYKRKF